MVLIYFCHVSVDPVTLQGDSHGQITQSMSRFTDKKKKKRDKLQTMFLKKKEYTVVYNMVSMTHITT